MRKYNGKPGDRRIVRRFLAVPVTINGETRWLETAYIEQAKFGGLGPLESWWESVAWATEEEFNTMEGIRSSNEVIRRY